MQKSHLRQPLCFLTTLVAHFVAIGCGESGDSIQAKAQIIKFSQVPLPALNETSVIVSASASSGLPVTFGSLTPSVCRVESTTGLVTATAPGTCVISANQAGDSQYAPAAAVTAEIAFSFVQGLAFTRTPKLALFDKGTVVAVSSAARPVTYVSTTPSVCSVDARSGLVDALAVGLCSIGANDLQLSAETSFPVTSPSELSAPGVPAEISVTAGDSPNSVFVTIGAAASGGSPILAFEVTSAPIGVTGSGKTLPIAVTCPSSCAGYGFAVSASNAFGTSAPSNITNIITSYDVQLSFYEPDTQPNNTVFVGYFSYDATLQLVSNLRGSLSESMTGGSTGYPNDTMTWLKLEYQLSAFPVDTSRSGFLVTTFYLPTTTTLSSDWKYGGTDGWSPGTGKGLYYGYPSNNPGNAYVRIYVNASDPTASDTPLDRLAYADCAPGGMMGATCMTGTTIAGYGSVGTMSGYPISQIIKKR